ncbi:unnamed protein product [Nesidiocoris tenuis]|uniref:Uncharacterized protein n=1 Tax=Nesidiocoris tenuis TaxID=355587 RepID=A0A6H5HHS9_9HEMI|nr:unnamed protein product [Nesidiocoris tenuis]
MEVKFPCFRRITQAFHSSERRLILYRLVPVERIIAHAQERFHRKIGTEHRRGRWKWILPLEVEIAGRWTLRENFLRQNT